jgi:hypothetical protein
MMASDANPQPNKSVSVLKILWDGEVLTAEFEENSANDNLIRQNNKRKRQLFDALANANDGELLQTFQLKLNKVVMSYQLKANLFKRVAAFNGAQRTAFDLAKEHISTQNPSQMIMLLIGEPGDGKTYVAQALCKFTFLVHGKQNGKFPSVMLDSKHCPYKTLTKLLISDADFTCLRHRLEKSVLIIIEDVNFLSLEDVQQINSRLAAITGKTHLPFGGFHVLMAGDLQKSSTASLHNGGTHIMTCHVPPHKHKAIAGQKLLLEHLTYCVDITKGTHANLTSFADHMQVRIREHTADMLQTAASLYRMNDNGL